MGDAQAIATVSRSFADAPDGPFYELWVDQLRSEPKPHVGSRVYRVSASTESESYTVLHVSGVRSDDKGVTWSVSLQAGDELRIVGSVEIDGTMAEPARCTCESRSLTMRK
ncbi:MAG: hypothetical protein AB7Q42_25270 [Acidimicrobiia bacterium]